MEWTVVELENNYLRVTVFPEIGGKIRSAVEKSTGRSFVYENHVVKFRDIAIAQRLCRGFVRAFMVLSPTSMGKPRIWPIVQVSDWGEPRPLEQVDEVLRHGARASATGVMVFARGGLRAQPQKIEASGRASRALAGSE
jgi:hypothetical protein